MTARQCGRFSRESFRYCAEVPFFIAPGIAPPIGSASIYKFVTKLMKLPLEITL
jgi:hypothetical protein